MTAEIAGTGAESSRRREQVTQDINYIIIIIITVTVTVTVTIITSIFFQVFALVLVYNC